MCSVTSVVPVRMSRKGRQMDGVEKKKVVEVAVAIAVAITVAGDKEDEEERKENEDTRERTNNKMMTGRYDIVVM